MFDDTHQGFIITCIRCKSTDVYVDNSLGFSAASGSWGTVDLVCNECGTTCTIVNS